MPEGNEDIEQLENEVPGFRQQYKKNLEELARRRLDQGINPNLYHLHEEAKDFTLKDIDKTTGTLKREVALAKIEELARQSQETGEEITIAFVDVNYLRTINNKRGHRAGDHAMKAVGSALRHSLRETDILGRYGGDEFIIAFRNINPEEAKDLVGGRIFPNVIEGITISVGIKKLDPKNLQQTLEDSDKAMFVAKEKAHSNGQNQVRTFESLTEEEISQANTQTAA